MHNNNNNNTIFLVCCFHTSTPRLWVVCEVFGRRSTRDNSHLAHVSQCAHRWRFENHGREHAPAAPREKLPGNDNTTKISSLSFLFLTVMRHSCIAQQKPKALCWRIVHPNNNKPTCQTKKKHHHHRRPPHGHRHK